MATAGVKGFNTFVARLITTSGPLFDAY